MKNEMTRKNACSILALVGLVALAACKPDDVPTEAIGTGGVISGGSGGSGGDESGGVVEPSPECLIAGEGEQTALQWQCGGRADVKVYFDFELPSWVPNSGELEALPHYKGGVSLFFGEDYEDSYDKPAVMGCCDSYPGAYGGAVEADYEAYPVYEDACVFDCVAQGRLAAIHQLEKVRDDQLGCFGCGGPRGQMDELIKWLKGEDGAKAWGDAFDGPSPYNASSLFDVWDQGTVLFPNSSKWSWLENVEIQASCRISESVLPEESERLSCASFEENDDFPWGAGLEDPDDFVAEGGDMDLDGPKLFGVEADGAASVNGVGGEGCSGGDCSRMSLSVEHGRVRLASLRVRAPSSLFFSKAGSTLEIENLRLQLSKPVEVVLPGTGRQIFKVPAGELGGVLSGKVHGVPLNVPVKNAFAVSGEIRGALDGRYTAELGPLEIEYIDEAGEVWNLLVSVDGWKSVGYAPRAHAQATRHKDGTVTLDGSGSTDADGDLKSYTWFVGEKEVGTGVTLDGVWKKGQTAVLVVSDRSGRRDFSVEYL